MRRSIAVVAFILASLHLFVADPANAQSQCLQLQGDLDCLPDGTIAYALQSDGPADFSGDRVDLGSLTPGVIVEPLELSLIPGSNISTWSLIGARAGQRVHLIADAVQVGGGGTRGTDLVCSGEVQVVVPANICEGIDVERPTVAAPDLQITVTGPETCEAGDRCRFTYTVRNAGNVPFEGILSVNQQPSVNSARLGNVGPSDTPWSCLQGGSGEPISCVSTPGALDPRRNVDILCRCAPAALPAPWQRV